MYDIMVGWKRWLYSIVGWEYDPPADEKQKYQKYLVTEQIKNTKDIQKILRENGEIKEQDFVHIDVSGQYSNNHYLNAVTRPNTPYPNNLILDNDGVIIDTPTGYTRLDNNNNNNNNNKRKSKNKKRKRIKH